MASPSLRQSNEWMARAKRMLGALGVRLRGDGTLPNGSRIVALPHVPETVRGFAALSMLIIDEAAYVSDEMYMALLPMLATTNGDLILMSTPNGKSGFFYDTWQHGGEEWHRVRVEAKDCPRIAAEFLEKQLSMMGRDIFGREYMCEFLGSGANAFDRELVEAAIDKLIEPMDPAMLAKPILGIPDFLSSRTDQRFFVALDLGKKNDFSTIVIVEVYGDELHVRFVERIALGTPYTKVVEIVREVVRSKRLWGRCELVVDASGVGEPVVDMLRKADLGCMISAVVITGGNAVRSSRSGGYTYIAKHELMTRLQLALEKGRLKIAGKMRECGALVQELLAVRVHENGGMGAAGRDHDDLVMALALGCWKAKRGWNDRGGGGFLG